MKTFTIQVTSMFTQTIEIEAKDVDTALEQASDKFFGGHLHNDFEAVGDTLVIEEAA